MRIIRGGQVRPKPPPFRTPAFRPETPDEFLPPRGVFLYWHLCWFAAHDRPQPGLAQLSADLRMPKSDISFLMKRMEAAGAIRTHRAKVYRNLPGISWLEIVATGQRTQPQGTMPWPGVPSNRAETALLLKPPATSRAGHGR
jgi:hypothetical protein